MISNSFSTIKNLLHRTHRIKTNRIKQFSYSSFSDLIGKTPKPEKFLVTGCLGQIGSELIPLLSNRGHKVVATDIRPIPSSLKEKFTGNVKYCYADVADENDLRRIVVENDITYVVHLAAKLSAVAEKNPGGSFAVNTRSVENVLELARQFKLKVYMPSSIAAFGPSTPNLNKIVDDVTIQRPLNVYGVSKVYMETLGEWYHYRFGVDFRSLRYPGILSSDTLPGGGTTDYAIEIFYAAFEDKGETGNERTYVCGVGPKRRLPMMYMPDCLRSTVKFLESESSSLQQGTYNVAAISFTPEEILNTMNELIEKEGSKLPIKPKPVRIDYKLDIRDQIAETWPAALNDTNARKDWKWNHEYDLEGISRDMLYKISYKLSQNHS